MLKAAALTSWGQRSDPAAVPTMTAPAASAAKSFSYLNQQLMKPTHAAQAALLELADRFHLLGAGLLGCPGRGMLDKLTLAGSSHQAWQSHFEHHRC